MAESFSAKLCRRVYKNGEVQNSGQEMRNVSFCKLAQTFFYNISYFSVHVGPTG